jgi:hypothetical protein
MFSSFGCEVTLLVSASRCCRPRTPRSPRRSRRTSCGAGCNLFKGARARASTDDDTVLSALRRRSGAQGSHALLAIGSIPNSEGLGLEPPGESTDGRLRHRRRPPAHQRAPHLRRRRPLRAAAAVVGGIDAGPQDRRARDGHARGSAATATSTTTRPPRPSSPNPRSPTSAWPRPTPSPRGARSGSPRCRSRCRPRPSSTTIPGLREDRVRPGHRRGARRLDRRSPRRRAHLGARHRRHQRLRSPTSPRACSCTPPCPRCWPRPPSDRLDDDDDVAGAHRVAGGDLDLGDGAGLVGGDVVLHLHGLEHAARCRRPRRVAHLDEDLHDRALHRHGDLPLPPPPAPPAGRCGGRAGPVAAPAATGPPDSGTHIATEKRLPLTSTSTSRRTFGSASRRRWGRRAGAAPTPVRSRTLLDPLGGVLGARSRGGEDGEVGGDGGGDALDLSSRGPAACGRWRCRGREPQHDSLPTRLS